MRKSTPLSVSSQIEKAKRGVLKKYNLLRRQLEDREEDLKRKFKPLTDEIKSLTEEIRKPLSKIQKLDSPDFDNGTGGIHI